MKRFLSIIVCVSYVLAAYAVSYGASYRGSRHSGVIYATSSVWTTPIGSNGVTASAPMSTMCSTSSYKFSQMSIGTSGVAPIGGDISIVNAPMLANTLFTTMPPDVHCNCVDNNHDHYCDNCGAPLDAADECANDPCWCPLDLNWGVVLFMVAMAAVYAYIKKTDLTSNSDVRNGRDMLA